MRHNITQRIDRHLDEQLGMWTRLLPWRHEMATHIEEAYETVQARTPKSVCDTEAWRSALANFGDVQDLAAQLRKEHWPQYIGWRIAAIVVSFSIVFSISNPLTLLDPPALGFALGPLFAFVLFDTFRGSTRWAIASRIGIWGGLCGAILGMVGLVFDMGSPSHIGGCMALSILSALYSVLLFTPRRTIVIALVSITVVDYLLMLVSMDALAIAAGSSIAPESYLPQHWSFDNLFVLQVLEICCAGLCAGIARFGFHGVVRHAASLGAGVFLISIVVMLGDMSDPSEVIGHLLVAFVAMTLAFASSHCISDSSRLVRRVLS